MKKLILLLTVPFLCGCSMKEDVAGYMRNGYVLDKDQNTLATYNNGYFLNKDGVPLQESNERFCQGI